jgi:hypothetical protein
VALGTYPLDGNTLSRHDSLCFALITHKRMAPGSRTGNYTELDDLARSRVKRVSGLRLRPMTSRVFAMSMPGAVAPTLPIAVGNTA